MRVGNPFIGGGFFMDYNSNTQTTGMMITGNLAWIGVGFGLSAEGVNTNFNVTVPWDDSQTYGVDITLKWPLIASIGAVLITDGFLIPAF